MRTIVLLFSAALCCGSVHAALPQVLNYQGYLTNSGGAPINGAVSMTLRLYNAASGPGAALWIETQPSVSVVNGVFDTALGSVISLPPLAFDVEYWLSVQINGDAEMSPRQAVLASPYAIRSATTEALAPTATVPVGQIAGTIATVQIANNSVTQAKLSPVSGAAAGKVLGTDGVNLQWQTDANSGGTMTQIVAGAGLTGGTITSSGTIAVDPASATLTGNFFKQGGNAFGTNPTVLGTTNANPLNIVVNGQRSLRIEPSLSSPTSPNYIAGSAANLVSAGLYGVTIGGGGSGQTNCGTTTGCWNSVLTGDFGANYATIGGGIGNVASGSSSTIAGGFINIASDAYVTVGGGYNNTASYQGGTVGGGENNAASGHDATVAGGAFNIARGIGAAVVGGSSNLASGSYATVLGGGENVAGGAFSVAAGFRAKTQTPGLTPTTHTGTFVFSDSSNADFNSVTSNEFAVRATGGARFVTDIDGANNPTQTISFKPGGVLDFGATTNRQVVNLWGSLGLGIQSFTEYFRTATSFAWFAGGTHSSTQWDPGAGGTLLMSLNTGSGVPSPIPSGYAYAASFTNTSDRNMKTGFAPVETRAVLAKVVALPLTSWAFRNDQAVRHIGPMAQDFHAAFAVGADDRTISTVDEGGVALTAIQGLYAELLDRDATIKSQAARIDALEMQTSEIAQLRLQMAELQAARLAPGQPGRMAAAR